MPKSYNYIICNSNTFTFNRSVLAASTAISIVNHFSKSTPGKNKCAIFSIKVNNRTTNIWNYIGDWSWWKREWPKEMKWRLILFIESTICTNLQENETEHTQQTADGKVCQRIHFVCKLHAYIGLIWSSPSSQRTAHAASSLMRLCR